MFHCLQFSVEFEKRANNIDRMKSINAFAEVVPPPHKVNLNTPQKSILVNILKNTCGIAVVEDYKGLSKFNIKALAGEGDGKPLPVKKTAASEVELPKQP
jgi:tRNA acetyltransferase TAN1